MNGKSLGSGGVSVDWPTVFEDGSCKPNFGSLDIDADTDFNLSLRDFDPFPSVSGTHTAGDERRPLRQHEGLHQGRVQDRRAGERDGRQQPA